MTRTPPALPPGELRKLFEAEVSQRERAWLERRDTCQCKRPCPKPRCLGVARCRRCDRVVR